MRAWIPQQQYTDINRDICRRKDILSRSASNTSNKLVMHSTGVNIGGERSNSFNSIPNEEKDTRNVKRSRKSMPQEKDIEQRESLSPESLSSEYGDI